MKPEWKDAPKWAQWLAQDSNGLWFWYEAKPVIDEGVWDNNGGGLYGIVDPPASSVSENWQETLEQRPPQDNPM